MLINRREFLEKMATGGLATLGAFLIPSVLTAETRTAMTNSLPTNGGLPDMSATKVQHQEVNDLYANTMNTKEIFIDGKKAGLEFKMTNNGSWHYIGKRTEDFSQKNNMPEDRMNPSSVFDRDKAFSEEVLLSTAGPFLNGATMETEGISVIPKVRKGQYSDTYSESEYMVENDYSRWCGFVIIKNDGSLQIVSRELLNRIVNRNAQYNSIKDYVDDVIIKNGHSLFQMPIILQDGQPGVNDSALQSLFDHISQRPYKLGFYSKNAVNNNVFLVEYSTGEKGIVHFNDNKTPILEQTALMQQKMDIINAVYLDSRISPFTGVYNTQDGSHAIGDENLDSEVQKYANGKTSNQIMITGGVLEFRTR